MKKRLLFMDLDGTLLNDKKQVALKNTTATKIETYLTEIMRSGSEAQQSEKSAAPAAE